MKFYASVRMDVRRIETLKQSGEMVGNRTRIKIVKNKIAPPFKEAEFDIMLEKESPKKEMFWIWQLVLILSRRVVRGMHMKERRSDRVVRMQKHI